MDIIHVDLNRFTSSMAALPLINPFNNIKASILLHPSNPKELSLTPLHVIVECSSSRRRDSLRGILYSIFVQGGAILFESRSIITIFVRIEAGGGGGGGGDISGGGGDLMMIGEEARVINAASSALVDAGIPLRFIPIAANVKCNENDTNAALVVFSMQDLTTSKDGKDDDYNITSHKCKPIFFDSKHHLSLTSIQIKALIDSGREASIDYVQQSYRS